MSTPETYNSSNESLSPLQVLSAQFVNKEIVVNRYTFENGYGINSKDAISDGDEFGKGQNQNGQVGSLTDINTRNQVMATNRYTENNGYGVTNVDAISDGDEFGKGQNQNGQIGSSTDINTRIKVVAINKFGENKKYPDFGA
jgi:hypothetical protein